MKIVREIVMPDDEAAREALQRRLAGEVVVTPLPAPRTIAGVDVAYEAGRGFAAAVVTDVFGEFLECGEWTADVPAEYVPGQFAAREAALALRALARLETEVDVLLVDGHGRAHPRCFGLACYLGLSLDVPTIGVAKTRLTGAFEPPAEPRGSWSPLVAEGGTVGAALRTADGVNPVYVSVGHRCDLETAIECVLEVCSRYRIPDPLREAHMHAGRLRAAARDRGL